MVGAPKKFYSWSRLGVRPRRSLQESSQDAGRNAHNMQGLSKCYWIGYHVGRPSLIGACLSARWAARRVPRAKDGGVPHAQVDLAAYWWDPASPMVCTARWALTSALFGAHVAEISLECRGHWLALRCHLVPGSTGSWAPSGWYSGDRHVNDIDVDLCAWHGPF